MATSEKCKRSTVFYKNHIILVPAGKKEKRARENIRA